MGTAAATAEASGSVRPAEFRAALERTLTDASADEKIGPLLGATGMRMRFEFPDCELILNVAAAQGEGGLRWSFGADAGWTSKLELRMDSAVANRYLQGRESLAIAIVRGQARFRGESGAALLYLPATRLLCEPYRRVVREDFPDLLSV